MYKRIILASASPRRHEILLMAGIDHIVRPGDCDESAIKEKDPAKLVEELSRLKAMDAVKRAEDGDMILASDTVVAIGGIILGKPHSEEDAKHMIRMISGKSHEVFTGVTLMHKEKPENAVTFHERTIVNIAKLSEEEIETYINTGESMGKAGAYAIQGIFGKHIKGIEGDYYNVMGLPVAMVYEKLKLFMKK